jgi:hypothetical protein
MADHALPFAIKDFLPDLQKLILGYPLFDIVYFRRQGFGLRQEIQTYVSEKDIEADYENH